MAHPTCESLGIRFSGEDAADATERIDEYFRLFQGGGNCPCGRSLGGVFGTFTWGIAHGEGFCSVCQWPARGYHTIDIAGLRKVNLSIILPYANEWVVARGDG